MVYFWTCCPLYYSGACTNRLLSWYYLTLILGSESARHPNCQQMWVATRPWELHFSAQETKEVARSQHMYPKLLAIFLAGAKKSGGQLNLPQTPVTLIS